MTVEISICTISTKVWDWARIKLGTPRSAVRFVTDCNNWSGESMAKLLSFLKGVRKVLSTVHHSISNHLKGNGAKNAFSMSLLFFLMLKCLLSNVFTQLCLLCELSFSRSRKILNFPKIVTFFVWFFTALLLRKCTKTYIG